MPALSLSEFTARLDSPVRVASLLSASPLSVGPRAQVPAARDAPDLPSDAGESPLAVLAAEIALLHARLDDLQSRLDR